MSKRRKSKEQGNLPKALRQGTAAEVGIQTKKKYRTSYKALACFFRKM
jgi:hypothetical protein